MKKIFALMICVLMMVSCVDDYTDANPPHRLDAPTFRIGTSGESQKILVTPIDRFQNTYQGYVAYDGSREFTVSIIDAPGKINEISAVPSVPEFGSIELDASTVNSVKGQTEGSFKFNFIPNPDLPDQADRTLNFVVSVADSQVDEKGESNPKITTINLPVRIVKCLTEGISGQYLVTAASGNLDGGGAYTLEDLEADAGGEIVVTISQDFPGRFTIDELTAGIWPTYYGGRARPTLKLDLCSNNVSGHLGAVTAIAPGSTVSRTFAAQGALKSDGSIDVTWSYVRNDAATPANPAKGTYTLTPID